MICFFIWCKYFFAKHLLVLHCEALLYFFQYGCWPLVKTWLCNGEEILPWKWFHPADAIMVLMWCNLSEANCARMSFACHSYQCVLGILIPTASCTFKQSKCSELLKICHHFFLALVTKHKSTHTTIQQTFSAYLHKWSGDFYPLRTEAFQTEDSGNGLCQCGKFTIAKTAIGRRNNGLLQNSFTRKLVELLLFSHCLLLPVAFFEFRGEDQPEVFPGDLEGFWVFFGSCSSLPLFGYGGCWENPTFMILRC